MPDRGRSRGGRGGKPGENIIFEFLPLGAYIKVSAVDEATGTEVSIVGDARASQAELERIALMKLDRALERRKSRPR